MRTFTNMMICAALLLLGLTTANAQVYESGQDDIDSVLKSMLEHSFITLESPIPTIQPEVTTLSRGSWRPDRDKLIKMFFGSRDYIMSDEEIINPRWGKGRRYKSGIILHLGNASMMQMKDVGGMTETHELVPTFLDVYNNGFVYVNNIAHTPVYATDVQVKDNTVADVSYYYVYEESEGQKAAEEMIVGMFGELQIPAGFQPSVRAIVQDYGERIFAYHAQLEHITSYNVYEYGPPPSEDAPPTKTVKGVQKISVPVYDSQVQVQLDGEKLLAGLEYFWDNELTIDGELRECIPAVDALAYAKETLLKEFDGNPPLLSVAQIKIAYVRDPKNPRKLVPAWLFDAWYSETVPQSETARPGAKQFAKNLINVALPFGVNALTGETFLLID